MDVGFIGVGAMGAAMANHCAEAGFAVRAFDTDAEALSAATSGAIEAAQDLTMIAVACDVVIIVVSTDDQTRRVVRRLLEAGPKAGQILVVAATTHPRTMIELFAECIDAGCGLIDAPVCYGLKGAIDGDLVSLCGGSAKDIAKVTPVLMTYSRSVEHLGPSGSGQLGKACNNMMHWAACVANFETLSLAKACGIDAQNMRETLLKCPARNTTLERWDTTRFTWHEKDLDVVLDLSQSVGLSLPLFGMVDQLVKRLGPDKVKDLLYGAEAEYLGQQVKGRPLKEIAGGS